MNNNLENLVKGVSDINMDKLDPNVSIDMEAPEFKDFAKSMVDYIADYLENIRDRRVLSDVKPGYLRPLIPDAAPETPESWEDVMKDIERVIMPGVTHWHSPKFHAYFPTANSYPAIVADMLSGAIACIGFSWIASPACTELEVVMLDWLGKMIGLPKEFLACSGGKGGGVIQGTASEATLVALLGAKAKKIEEIKKLHPDWSESTIISKLVGYSSSQAHSSVERAGLLGGVKLRGVPADKDNRLRGEALEAAIKKDLEDGLIPFYAVVTLGTTNTCAFDYLDECGPVGNKYGVWIHVDAAYAGAAFICPEYRHLMKGIETADSFNFNPHKWMLVNFDCSAMWLKDPSWVVNAFNVDPLYLKHDMQGSVPDYRHWQIPLGRRFRALKLWFVLRLYGVQNLQAHIRRHCGYATHFADLCRADDRFEIVGDVNMGLVCFRLKGPNEQSEKLLKHINGRGNIHMVPSKINDVYFLRMAVCSRFTKSEDMDYSWNEISEAANDICKE
ncbi:aromatic-L-amino-acid decarboxylase isoform X1 [Zeugodacus cucurbitae]|uniref:aromatic-L-amino-acid decarboxylase isoform X1 n=2 Tax=Zeugodacus cucurbitae TaxID=28588 RepID=UPI000596A843|nr:aromatic-L-amino-acid decarboxylase isoform X1 [Zeugodacus cucurbitae]XP_011190722.1 aromatic-L-amino-acid decarboxylase isoform X1 [Zeugodacus cucurbitae]